MPFALESPAFPEGGRIPKRFTADGADVSPYLRWVDLPEGTQALAIVLKDPDAPSGTFYHWGAWNIPPVARGLPEGHRPSGGAREALNDFQRKGYGGPRPPRGHGPHHYRFRLFALKKPLELPENADAREVEKAAESQAIAVAELSAAYER
jgi:Raf kinase inhibitor-like YbhB/YbcL family protein